MPAAVCRQSVSFAIGTHQREIGGGIPRHELTGRTVWRQGTEEYEEQAQTPHGTHLKLKQGLSVTPGDLAAPSRTFIRGADGAGSHVTLHGSCTGSGVPGSETHKEHKV